RRLWPRQTATLSATSWRRAPSTLQTDEPATLSTEWRMLSPLQASPPETAVESPFLPAA
ncbi:erg26, partial [Symbiodinium sp. KB8]